MTTTARPREQSVQRSPESGAGKLPMPWAQRAGGAQEPGPLGTPDPVNADSATGNSHCRMQEHSVTRAGQAPGAITGFPGPRRAGTRCGPRTRIACARRCAAPGPAAPAPLTHLAEAALRRRLRLHLLAVAREQQTHGAQKTEEQAPATAHRRSPPTDLRQRLGFPALGRRPRAR